jgi:hypothetical protein
VFDNEWTMIRYLVGWVQARVRSVRDGDPQSGALTLEWIIIAVALALIAGIAVAVFVSKVKADDAKLP